MFHRWTPLLSGVVGSFVFSFLFFLTFAPLHAGEEREQDDSRSKKANIQITISTPTRLERPIKDSSGSVSLVIGSEIDERNPIMIPEVVKRIPGVRLQESGTMGESTSISIRGAEASQTLILLDGIRLNSPFRGGFDFGSFLMDGVDQIEIVRGGQSALYGSEAMGGVVNLRTKRPAKPFQISFKGEVGNEETFREVISVEGKKTVLDYRMTLSHTATEGQFERDHFRGRSLSGQIGLSLGRTDRVQYIYRYQDTHKELAIDLVPELLDPMDPTTLQVRAVFDDNNEIERDLLFQSIQYQGKVNPWFGLSWKAALVETDRKQENPVDSVNLNSSFENTDNQIITVDLQQNVLMGDSNTLSFGFEWREESVKSTINLTPVNQSRQNKAYYLQELFQWEEKFILQAGVRVDDNSDFDTVINPKISLAYQFDPTKTKFRGSWGKNFRAPSIQEQFDPSRGNPDLNSERSKSWEAGLQQTFLADRIFMDLAFYWIDYKQLIQISPTGVSNIGKARTRGVESRLEIQLLPSVKTTISYTYLDAKDRDKGEELPFRARHRGSINVFFSPLLTLAMNLDVHFVSSQALPVDFVLLNGAVLTGRSPGYTRVDLSGTYYLLGRLGWIKETRIFLKVRNLFDQDYQDVPGFPAPGVGFTGGLMFNF